MLIENLKTLSKLGAKKPLAFWEHEQETLFKNLQQELMVVQNTTDLTKTVS